jgi:FkbH-like protein
MLFEWLLPPVDFRRQLTDAVDLYRSGSGADALIALADQRLSFLETLQLDKALEKVVTVPASCATLRLALLSSATVDHLLPGIRVAGWRRRLKVETYKGSFAQYRQEILGAGPELLKFKPSVVLLSLSAHDFIGDLSVSASEVAAEERVELAVAELEHLWGLAQERFGAAVIQQLFIDTSDPIFGSYDRLVPGSPSSLVERLNAGVTAAARKQSVAVLDMPKAIARFGLDFWYDHARWLQAKIEICPSAGPAYGELVARILGAKNARARKCLVLDLDNTLWGGIVGDDGMEGILLGQGTALGEAHAALQTYARALRTRGILLAVCSKNDPEIARQAISNHPEMILTLSDFSVVCANWSDKAENLITIARELNIGLDAMVFLDDNPVERARIRAALPLVAVPELPTDPAWFVRTLAGAGYFEADGYTDEDQDRAEQYAANRQRDALRQGAQSVEDYLHSLQMKVEFGEVSAINLTRAAQLVNKTNQFNTTTWRCSADELARFAGDPAKLALQFRLADRFGDNGLVSVVLLRPRGDSPEVLEIANWVMSCRVFGRQLEVEIMNTIVERAARRGTRRILGLYKPTDRNGVIAGLFTQLGFERQGVEEGIECWALDVASYVARDTPLTLIKEFTA